jgi:uncharacterized protein YgbK (DUF1537 family)
MECLIVADDLTGACDAAGPFAARGYTVRVALEPTKPGAPDVVAISTDTRDAPVGQLPPALSAIANSFGNDARPRILFKKIDSTLRGNAPAEVSAALDAFACAAAIVTPAFPAMHRVVIDGILSIPTQPNFTPVDLPAHFRERGAASTHAAPHQVADSLTRSPVITCDAASDEHLDAIVAAGLTTRTPILWAGSSGLAAALARALPQRTAHHRPAPTDAPMLFCAGSNHAVTIAQQESLQAERPVEYLSAEACSPAEVQTAISSRTHVILRLPRGRIGEDRVRILLADVPGPLLVTGGDTASLLYRALGMRGITLRGEISPGIPYGVIEGGVFDGHPIVTKSGGFGAPSAFIEVADFFTCPQT